jgi:hypothetical protein
MYVLNHFVNAEHVELVVLFGVLVIKRALFELLAVHLAKEIKSLDDVVEGGSAVVNAVKEGAMTLLK